VEIALYVEPRSAVLEKLRGAIKNSGEQFHYETYYRWNGCDKGVYF
jgi:hypothetical protein